MDGDGDGDGSLRFDFEDDVHAFSAGSGFASSEAPILAVGGPSRGRGHGSIEMDGDEDSLRFDFEDGLDAAGAGTESSAWPFEAPIPAAGGPSHGPGSGSIQMDGAGTGSLAWSFEAPIPAAGGPSYGPGSGSIQMDGDEDSLHFDIEDYLDAAGAGTGSSVWSFEVPIPAAGGPSHGPDSGSIQMDGDEGSLRFDLDAVGAGSGSDEEIPECIMFSVGFCLNGPNCKCMHVKLPGPPPVQEVLQKFQQTNAYNYGSSSTTYHPRDNNCKQKAKPQVQHESVLENQNLAVNATLVAQQPAAQHVQTENPPPHLQQQQNAQVQGVHNGSSIQKLPQLQAHFHKGNQGTWLLNFATRRIWILVQWGVFAPQKGLMRLNLTKHVHGECHFNILHL
ncbi:hypothetical protein ACQJBY_037911 [Aegilops geniculata]